MKNKIEKKKIINHPDWELYYPGKVTWMGFLIAWLIVGFLIFGTVILARIGA